ncbi:MULTISPECIES: hypothetical protein [unclassified Streptomyces]|nr:MULTISPECIES: hypothetical protein [unclassified Streptomyces]MYX28351.1 hypothetical protein [Streptomyces sp. SID8381]
MGAVRPPDGGEHRRGPWTTKIIAELSMALDALGTFPTMLELRHVPHGG